jgi:signal recognition particle subunit SEC65
MGENGEQIDDLVRELGEDSERADSRKIYIDVGSEFGRAEYNAKSGILKVDAVLSREMIYHYEDCDALRSLDELKAIAPFIKGTPITRGHPPAKIVTDRSEVLGWAVSGTIEDDELRVVLAIADKGLIEDIKSKKLTDVSAGQFSAMDNTLSGEFNGKHYNATQRDIFVDHIAIVPTGRCSTSDGCGLKLDAVEEEPKSKEEEKEEEKEKDEDMEVEKAKKEVDAAVKIIDAIPKKLEELESVLKEAKDEKEVPGPVASKLKKAESLAGTVKTEVKKGEAKLETAAKTLGGKAKDESDYPNPPSREDSKEGEVEVKIDEKLKASVDEIRAELDAMKAEEKGLLVDELVSIQDVKKPDELKGLSIDTLKSDLEMLKAVKQKKLAFDLGEKNDKGGAIRDAYKEVGRKG